jgi:hypothetical protein
MYAHGVAYPISDGRGRFLGDALPASWFEVRLEPGYHLFVASGENTAALRAWLAPGRTYFVEVASRMGWFSPRVQLLAIAPRFERWQEREAWIARSEGHITVSRTMEPEDLRDLARRGAERIADYAPSELDERTLLPSDGF